MHVCWVPMLGTLVLRVEYPYNVRKLKKSLDMGEPTFHAEKTTCYQLQQQTNLHVLALARQTTFENCIKFKALNKGCSARNQMILLHCSIKFLSAHELLLPLPP